MVRFGIVGAGRIAQKFAQDIQFCEQAELVAVASRSMEKAQMFQQEFDIPYAFGSYDELANSDLIDAVYIATPHNFHKEQSILFLNKKKHVLCEKPIAVNTNELLEMIEAAKTNNCVLMEAMWTRFLPAFRHINQRIESGDLGKLLQATLRFGIPLTDSATEEGRILNPNLAGGSLLDVGIYPVSIFKFVNQDPIQSMASTAKFSKSQVDLHTLVSIVLDNPQHTTVTLESAVDRELSNTMELQFEKGEIRVPHFWTGDEVIDNGQRLEFPFKKGGFEYEIDHFCQTVLSGAFEDSIMNHHESIIVMKLMDRIRSQIGLIYPFE